MAIKHRFVSTNEPSPDAASKGLVTKDPWNDDHSIEGGDTEFTYNNAGSLDTTTGITYAYDTVEGSGRIGINQTVPDTQLHMDEPDSGGNNFFARDLFSSDLGIWTFTSGGDWNLNLTTQRMERLTDSISIDTLTLDYDWLKAEFFADTGRELTTDDVLTIRLTISTTTPGDLRLRLGNQFSITQPTAAKYVGTWSSQYYTFPIDDLSATGTFSIEARSGWTGYIDSLFFYERQNPDIRGIKFGPDNFLQSDGSRNVIFGQNCNLYSDGFDNITIGTRCMQYALGGRSNIAIGDQALEANQESDDNVAIGAEALESYVGRSGSDGENIAIGNQAGEGLEWGDSNLLFGSQAGRFWDYADDNIAIGVSAGIGGITPNRCIAIGNSTSLSTDAADELNIGNTIFGDISSTDKQVVVRGGTGQSQNIFEVQNSSSTALFSVGSTGDLLFSQGLTIGITRVTTTTTLDTTAYQWNFNTDSAALTANLPAGVAGRTYKIVNTGTSGNNLTVSPNGLEKLVGTAGSFTLLDGESLIITYEATDGWY